MLFSVSEVSENKLRTDTREAVPSHYLFLPALQYKTAVHGILRKTAEYQSHTFLEVEGLPPGLIIYNSGRFIDNK